MRERPRERCDCGQWPRFSCVQVAEDAVESWFHCTGAFGCGKAGPVVEDAWADRDTAASKWDAMRRAEKRVAA